MAKAPADIRSAARSHTQTALDTLVMVMRNKNATDAARVQASIYILDRGWGKPQQTVVANITKHDATDYTRTELLALLVEAEQVDDSAGAPAPEGRAGEPDSVH